MWRVSFWSSLRPPLPALGAQFEGDRKEGSCSNRSLNELGLHSYMVFGLPPVRLETLPYLERIDRKIWKMNAYILPHWFSQLKQGPLCVFSLQVAYWYNPSVWFNISTWLTVTFLGVWCGKKKLYFQLEFTMQTFHNKQFNQENWLGSTGWARPGAPPPPAPPQAKITDDKWQRDTKTWQKPSNTGTNFHQNPRVLSSFSLRKSQGWLLLKLILTKLQAAQGDMNFMGKVRKISESA